MLDANTSAVTTVHRADPGETSLILERHLASFGNGLDAILVDYSDDAILVTETMTFRGKTEIRSFFEDFLKNASEQFWAAFDLHTKIVEGEVAYIVWSAKPQVMLGTDTIVVRQKRIVLQTFASYQGCPTMRELVGRESGKS